MLTLQETKVLSALVTFWGINNKFDLDLSGSPEKSLDDVIDQIITKTGLPITFETAVRMEEIGVAVAEGFYRLDFSYYPQAKEYLASMKNPFISQDSHLGLVH